MHMTFERQVPFLWTASVFLCFLFVGCAMEPTIAPPPVPEGLRPSSGQVAYVEARATGVQIYECTTKAKEPASYEWTFRSPEANLFDRDGKPIGKHYAGPTWESVDSSAVVGEIKSKDPGPIPSAIPWLLLTAKSVTGTGVFAAAKSIQRVSTAGGIAPARPCSATNSSEVARIPYTATYYFYRAAQ